MATQRKPVGAKAKPMKGTPSKGRTVPRRPKG